ncbi:ATP-binding protein [Propionivibrio sp.]|uniref:ATP-binding protein n=1 Tax=Propionivibrio sp. TaxID=2212460 RepID=UPI003BF37B1C
MAILLWRSLKARLTLFTLAIFLTGIWGLSLYASRLLREDLERLLGDQQFSTVSFIAAQINQELGDRLRALETVAGSVTPAILGNTAALQAMLERRPIFQSAFNGGTFVTGMDGTATASIPLSAERLGVNYMDRDFIVAALKEGKSTIGRPVMGKKLLAPIFVMAVPIRNTQGKVIGALAGITNLEMPNFLNNITNKGFGKTGSYLLMAPQHQLFVTASDKSRNMQPLPAPGLNRMHDKYMQGYEGYGVATSSRGVEVLSAAKDIPLAGWKLVAVLPTAEAFAPIGAMQQHILQASILLTLLAGGLVWWITALMLRRQFLPMLATSRMLDSLPETNQPPLLLPITSNDEIGELIGGFNRLLNFLGKREKALQQSETFKNIILNSVAAEIAVLDRNGVILAVNERWRRFSRENAGEPGNPAAHTDVGSNYLTVCQPVHGSTADDDAVNAGAGIRAVLDGSLPSFRLEYPCHSAQQQRWFTMIVMPLGQDVINGVAITHSDITEHKEIEARLVQALIKAEAATLAKSEFLAHMTHEIRTPMNAIVGAARLIEYESLTPRQLGYCQIMQNSSQSLLALIDNILDLSKIEAGHIELKKEPFDLARIVDGLAGVASVAIQDKAIEISFDLAPDLPPLLIGDHYRLEQVLNNLLSNAIKFTAKGKITLQVLKVSADAENAQLLFALSDSGIGISPEKLDAIFDAFVQAESTTTRLYSGTGLGLAISRQLVELMGGALVVNSAPGEGSRFSFTVPFQLPQGTEAVLPPARLTDQQPDYSDFTESISPLAGCRVLMVEDNQFNRQVLEGMLHHFGIEVDAAIDGNDGVKRFQAGSPYDAILMDLHLPRINGFDCARAIRALPEGQQVPIIALTANVLSTTADQCRAAGMNEHLSKPVEPEMLHRSLMSLILGEASIAPVKAPPVENETAESTENTDLLPDNLPGIERAKASFWSNGSARALAKLLDLMLAHSGDDRARITQHIAAGDLAAAAQMTHDLVAVAATIGASPLVAAARQLDREIRAGSPGSTLAQEAIDSIDSEFSQLYAAQEMLRVRAD